MKGFNINNPMEIISYKMMSYKNGYLYSVESHLLRLAIESLKNIKDVILFQSMHMKIGIMIYINNKLN